MRQLLAVALVLMMGAVTAPACAQRGGGRGSAAGGFHGSFGGRAAVSAHAGYFGAGRYGYAGMTNARSYGGRGYNVSAGFAGGRAGGVVDGRNVYARRRGDLDHRHFGAVPYVAPYGYAGWGDAGYLWSPDEDGQDDDGTADGPPQYPGADAEGYYAQQPPYAGPVEYGPPPYGSSEQGSQGPPAQQEQPASAGTNQTAGMYDSDAVTLVFNDGRPPEKIHNYALTRTMLYVTDTHRQEIPVAELNLEATQKANREAGVNFQLPQAGR